MKPLVHRELNQIHLISRSQLGTCEYINFSESAEKKIQAQNLYELRIRAVELVSRL